MTSARAIEYRIIRNILKPTTVARRFRSAERLIAVTAVTSALVVIGSVAPELVVAGLLAALIVSTI